jgi:class 3 adenylate cyclase/tetratricopeptide (TPR) repeat protein
VRACPSCGGENSDQARFCQLCATPLAGVEPAHEARKIVSVVFTDVTGSTSLGERLDPETLRRVMSRYFDAMRAVIERHGGTVEKFIGDAVMAVFGIPQVHEDDALRAVRAAAEMRGTLDVLNAELERDRGVTIRTRTGVATGEVVAGADASSGERLVTGDTVNVAARLEQSAQPGEILISATTHALVRDAVDVKPLEALELKGKSEPVLAYRLVAVRSGVAGRERHLESPMVGRERQLRMLLETFDASVTERACHLFTVLGSPGVGKSRLVREFLGAVSESASVHAGRCLSYGDGITFWPLDEIARSIAGVSEAAATDELIARLREVLAGADELDVVVARIAGLLGLSPEPVALTDGLWAARKLFEHVAAERPIVLVIDDIHWGEPTMLDLIEQVADWSRDAPIVLLCTARPELMDVRPNWAGGKPNATSILLEPLTTSECDRLIENLVGSAKLPPDARERITSAAEGNPLFVEEMLGMLIDDGLLRRDDGRWVATGDLSEIAVPSTIQALIAARLDRLVSEERTVIERGAIEGKLFHLGSVTALAPEPVRPAVRDRLMSLVRKELIRPDRSDFAGDEAFRFRHLLIRDAAYESMPKETRAELHERFAEWLASRASETPGGLDAILAYHYEQAYRYRTELGGAGERARQLGGIAGARYASAGAAALSRTDASTAIALLERAVTLAPRDLEVRLALANAYELEGSMGRAEELATEVQHAAEAAGNRPATMRAELQRAVIRSWTDPSWTGREHLETVRRLAREFEALGDDLGMARALLADALYATRSEGLRAARRAAEHARRAGDARAEADALGYEAIQLFWGPTSAADGAARCEAILAAAVPDRGAEALVLASLGGLRAMLGDAESGRSFASRARSILLDLGTRNRAHAAFVGGYIGWFAGDLDEADAGWRGGYEMLDSIGEKNRLSSLAGLVALTLALRGRWAEALNFVRIGTEAGAPDDEDTQSLVRSAESIVRSNDGEHDEAVRLATEAVAFLEGREAHWQQGDAYRILGDALATAGRRSEAADAYARALALYEAKGVLPLMDRAKARLAALGR